MAGERWFPLGSWKTGAKVLAGVLGLVHTAQAWTITNVNIGTDLNSVAWGKVNNNNNTIAGVLNAQAMSNAWFAGQISNALVTATTPAGNLVQSSYLLTLTNINPLNFSGSNYIGQFSQLFSFALSTPLLGGGGTTPPTNQFEEVVLSYNGTAWFPLTNANGAVWLSGQPAIFQNVRVAVVGAAGNAGSLVINGLNATNLWNRTNSLVGQVTQVSPPVNPADAASKQYVDAHTGTASPWVASVDTNAVTHCNYSFNGVTEADLASAPAWIRIDGLAADGTGTNLVLTINQTNLAPGWAIHFATNLLTPVGSWPGFTNYTLATNTGELSFTIPINFTLPAEFFLAEGTGSNWVSLNAPVNVAGALTQNGAMVLTNNQSGVVLSGTIAGNGSGLTNLGAASLTGSVPLGALGNAITNWAADGYLYRGTTNTPSTGPTGNFGPGSNITNFQTGIFYGFTGSPTTGTLTNLSIGTFEVDTSFDLQVANEIGFEFFTNGVPALILQPGYAGSSNGTAGRSVFGFGEIYLPVPGLALSVREIYDTGAYAFASGTFRVRFIHP